MIKSLKNVCIFLGALFFGGIETLVPLILVVFAFLVAGFVGIPIVWLMIRTVLEFWGLM